MQHNDGRFKTHRIDGAIGASTPVVDDFEYPRRSKSVQWLGLLVLLSDLREAQALAARVNHLMRQCK
jgi:hypothetical protein